MPPLSPEKKATLLRQLAEDEREGIFKSLEGLSEAEALKWVNEIEMLERRTHKSDGAHEFLDLGQGDQVAIRVALPETDLILLRTLDAEKVTLTPGVDGARLDEIACELLGIVTANPILTKEYWMRHRQDGYSPSDGAEVIIGFYERRALRNRERNQRLAALGAFREKPPGAELR